MLVNEARQVLSRVSSLAARHQVSSKCKSCLLIGEGGVYMLTL